MLALQVEALPTTPQCHPKTTTFFKFSHLVTMFVSYYWYNKWSHLVAYNRQVYFLVILQAESQKKILLGSKTLLVSCFPSGSSRKVTFFTFPAFSKPFTFSPCMYLTILLYLYLLLTRAEKRFFICKDACDQIKSTWLIQVFSQFHGS